MAAEENPRLEDEWRVEVKLEGDEQGASFGELLKSHNLDDDARKRLGGEVVVTRDGPQLYLYAWHEQSAREAERVVRELLEAEGLAAEVELKRWHPAAEDWKPADEPLPETADEEEAERESHEERTAREAAATGHYEWQVVAHMPDHRSAREFAHKLQRRDLPIKQRWRYVLIGVANEDDAIELGKELEGEVPPGAEIGVRANPSDVKDPAFILLGSLKPGALRDLGL
jgi:hypothetical protein